jgi:hypothetical protein
MKKTEITHLLKRDGQQARVHAHQAAYAEQPGYDIQDIWYNM